MVGEIMSGAIAMGFAVAGVFFLRFWRDTGDRLFGLFALAFFINAASRVAIALAEPAAGVSEERYWVRFAAFLFILIAILDKNRARRPSAPLSGPAAPAPPQPLGPASR